MEEDESKSGEQKKRKGWRRFTDALKGSTILARPALRLPALGGSMRKVREAVYPGYLDPVVRGITNPYHHAKERFNGLWNWRERRAAVIADHSPLSRLTTVRGAMAAYWTGEQLKESLKPTLSIAGLVIFSAGTTTMMLETYAETISALFNDGDIALGAAKFAALGAANVASNKYIYKLSNDLGRNMALWIREEFRQEIEDNPDIVAILQEKEQEAKALGSNRERSSPHHAIARAPEELARNLVNTGTRGFASVTTAAAMLGAIAYNSQPVPVLGEYGTLILASAVVGSYSWFTYAKGAALGKKVELEQEAHQKAEARLTENMVKTFDPETSNGKNHLANGFVDSFSEDNREIYDVSEKHDRAEEKYVHFMQMTGLGGFFVSPIPALASIPWAGGVLSALTQKSFLATHAQTQFLLNTVSQGINLVASRGRITVPAKIISDMACDFIEAKNAVEKNGNATGDEDSLDGVNLPVSGDIGGGPKQGL